ncbi:hypothetical protein [Spirosoma sp. KNUC1025]|uniref:hypothetical protein n=1 Tax=Spirosoma sp. KNUC1025 TaxID=2894082 RepID=UPI003866789A|nr:T9SS type A sorting domain-containing protein [Spirosoma sp. KNUC1025]
MSTNSLLKSLLVSPLLLTVSLVVAQPNPFYQPPRSDSTRGYWKLYTDYSTRMTRVSFYSSQDELLYQEKIKDRYINLTKRTIRQFDNLLNRLVAHNLIAGQVKSYDLLASNQWTAVPKRVESRLNGEVITSASSNVPTVNLEVVSSSQVKLSYLNPANEKLLITLANESYQFFYKKHTTANEYAGLLNVSHLPTGTYRLEVDGVKKTVQYQLIIDQDNHSIKLNTLLNQFNP